MVTRLFFAPAAAPIYVQQRRWRRERSVRDRIIGLYAAPNRRFGDGRL